MNDGQGWKRECLLVGLITVCGYLAGSVFGQPLYGLLLALVILLSVAAWDLHRMSQWTRHMEREPPFRAGVWGSITDTLYVRARDQRKRIDMLESRLQQLQSSYSALPDAVVLVDLDNTIHWCNRPAEKLLGLRYPDDVGVPICDLVRVAELEDFLDSGEFDRAIEIASPRQPVVPLEVRAGRFDRGSKVVFFRNIESYKRLETMRQDFVSSMSHEMRTPLTVISGYLDTLEGVLSDGSPMIEKILGQMKGQARRMENLLQDLILLSRLEVDGRVGSDDEELIILPALIESLIDNALTACDHGREILFNPGEVNGSFLARRVELESIFANLIFNAVKYTHEGGRIVITLSRDSGGDLMFSVQDNGIGIDPEHIPHLTERFYRADKSRSAERGGTGLGLAIVKHALRHIDGQLSVLSYPGQGSTFSCSLPGSRYFEPEPVAVTEL